MGPRIRLSKIVVIVAGCLIITTLTSLGAVRSAHGASNFGQPVPGTHIYDRAGVLSPEQIATLEVQAQGIQAAGAPVVVFLQARSASYDETENDAQNLMDAWDVQSAPAAHDGLVLFFNLTPKDLHHGQAAFYAGKAQYDGGNLPKYELQRIFDHDMKPLLASGDLAGGISAGLVAVHNSLVNGPAPPPEPTAFAKLSQDVSAGPFSLVNVIAALVVAIYLWFTSRVWNSRPRALVPIAATTNPPNPMTPAMVGALVTGRVGDNQIEATILYLARRGALAIEPTGKKQVQIRLIDAGMAHDDLERSVWSSMSARADSDGIVSSANLKRIRSDWGDARRTLRRELEVQGWFAPDASARRNPVYLASGALVLLASVAFVFTVVGQEAWGFAAVGLLAAAAVGGIIAMVSIPDTTQSGEEAVAPWNSYIAGIKRAKSDETLNTNLNLDEAMPYAVAAGTTSSLDKRLKQASNDGYAPAWLGPTLHQNNDGYSAYACWFAFHAAVTPSSSGASGAGGAASAGGGGAGGSF